MLLIECPWCGPRAESEFSCGGEADIVRPVNNENMTDREWVDLPAPFDPMSVTISPSSTFSEMPFSAAMLP